MSMAKTLRNDGRVLWKLLASRSQGCSHEDRLRHFYTGQADAYDAFRRKLLHGRQSMIDQLPVHRNDVWVDLGCGTGENLERFGEKLDLLSAVHLVDLCEPLLALARQRVRGISHPSITCHLADATQFNFLLTQ